MLKIFMHEMAKYECNFGRLVAQTNANQNAHTSAYDLIFTKFNFRQVKLEKEII